MVGTIALGPLGGCTRTQTVPSDKEEQLSIHAKSSKKFEKLAKETRQMWKELFASQKKDGGKFRIPKDKYDAAMKSLTALVAHYRDFELEKEVDPLLAGLNLADPQLNELGRISREAARMAVPDEHIQALRIGWLQGDREKARRNILERGGSYEHLKALVSTLRALPEQVNAPASAIKELNLPSGDVPTIQVDVCQWWGPAACAAFFAAAAVLCSGDCWDYFALAYIACIVALGQAGCPGK
jgi:hypothetical protein